MPSAANGQATTASGSVSDAAAAEEAAEEAAARAALLSNEGDAAAAAADAHRLEKEALRDAAVKCVMTKGRNSVRAALGMRGAHFISDEQVQKHAVKTLRLLHPDFSINIALKGTKKHGQIMAAFKKLSALRDASE